MIYFWKRHRFIRNLYITDRRPAERLQVRPETVNFSNFLSCRQIHALKYGLHSLHLQYITYRYATVPVE